MNKYGDFGRQFSSEDGSVHHTVVLNQENMTTFALLSVDSLFPVCNSDTDATNEQLEATNRTEKGSTITLLSKNERAKDLISAGHHSF